MVKGDTPAQDKINKEYFENLCGLQCTEEEIAAFFDVDADTLVTWVKKNYHGKTFSDVYKQKKELGNISLRRNMMKMSETVPSVAIFLAKNRLGMSDKVEQINTFKNQPKLEVEIVNNENLEEVMYEDKEVQ